MATDEHGEPAVKRKGSAFPWFLILLLIGAGAVGYWWFDQRLQDAKAAVENANRQQEEAQRKADAQAGAAEELRAQLAQLQGDNAHLAAAKDELSKDIAAKEDELAQLKGTYDALQDKMKAEIAKGDIQLSEVGGKVQVDLVDKILFDSGEAKISSRGEEVLQRVGAVLAKIDDKQIQVSGHTDDSPISERLVSQFPTNWELSAARATNVVRFLNEKAGVPGKRLVASGYGPFHPIASNATPTGRARNRRIEILLTPITETVANKQVVAAAAKAPAPAHAVVPAKATVSHKPVATKAVSKTAKPAAKKAAHPAKRK